MQIRFQIVKVLLQRGANPDLRDEDGKTALDKARERTDEDHTQVAQILESPSVYMHSSEHLCLFDLLFLILKVTKYAAFLTELFPRTRHHLKCYVMDRFFCWPVSVCRLLQLKSQYFIYLCTSSSAVKQHLRKTTRAVLIRNGMRSVRFFCQHES